MRQTVVYVDSGSADGSAEYARSVGCRVVELDASRPFSAARARNEGFACAMEHAPDTEFVQFVDGDCELEEGWIEAAASTLAERDDVGHGVRPGARDSSRGERLQPAVRPGVAAAAGRDSRPQAGDSWRVPEPSRRWADFAPM